MIEHEYYSIVVLSYVQLVDGLEGRHHSSSSANADPQLLKHSTLSLMVTSCCYHQYQLVLYEAPRDLYLFLFKRRVNGGTTIRVRQCATIPVYGLFTAVYDRYGAFIEPSFVSRFQNTRSNLAPRLFIVMSS